MTCTYKLCQRVVLGFSASPNFNDQLSAAAGSFCTDLDVSHRAAHTMLFVEHINQHFQLSLEDPRGDVWPISGTLAWLWLRSDLRPLGVAGLGDEEIWLSMLAHNCLCILEQMKGNLMMSHVRCSREKGRLL